MNRFIVVASMVGLSLAGNCGSSDVYTVVERQQVKSTSAFQPWVELVLLHNGKKLNGRCNNLKAAPNTNDPVACKARVGDVLTCQAFADRMSYDAGGYDLICGDDRENGKLITSAKNELIQIAHYDAMYEAKRKAEIAKHPVPLAIVYDEWWSSDYAANGASRRCQNALTELCQDNERGEESAFFGQFSGAFQSDPSCAGLRLLVFRGPKNTSEEVSRAMAEINDREHWWLMVDFSSTLQKQPWNMTYYPAAVRYASGEGDPLSVARSVCKIAKNRGGSVID